MAASYSIDLATHNRDGFYSPVTILDELEALDHRRRLEDIERTTGSLHYAVKPHLISTSAAEIIRNETLLDAVEAILGADILAWDSAYVIKEPGTTGHVSWHQDLTYWGLENDHLVTAWVALSPATPASGCMRMLPGSHLGGRLEHHDTHGTDNILHRGQEVDAEIDESAIEYLALKPGQASLHHGWVMHASAPNTSGDRRIGLTIQYTVPANRQRVADWDSASLVRGTDAYGHFRAEPRPTRDLDPDLVAYQKQLEARKHQVYDTA